MASPFESGNEWLILLGMVQNVFISLEWAIREICPRLLELFGILKVRVDTRGVMYAGKAIRIEDSRHSRTAQLSCESESEGSDAPYRKTWSILVTIIFENNGAKLQ